MTRETYHATSGSFKLQATSFHGGIPDTFAFGFARPGFVNDASFVANDGVDTEVDPIGEALRNEWWCVVTGDRSTNFNSRLRDAFYLFPKRVFRHQGFLC